MGANKTDKAIERASKASGGITKIVEAFEQQVNIAQKSATHSHKSSIKVYKTKKNATLNIPKYSLCFQAQ